MFEFILNDRLIRTSEPAGTTVLDLVRYKEGLPGTKIGCREGDCGACTVMVGELQGDRIVYRTMTSCLLALTNVHGRHVVTVEGINLRGKLNMVQQAMVDESGTQCGFCTPGFVVSLASLCLEPTPTTYDLAIRAMDGNICRCTGYKSIERAAMIVVDKLHGKDEEDPLNWSVKRGYLPEYFAEIKARLQAMRPNGQANGSSNGKLTLAGGTDLYVQRHESMHEEEITPVFNDHTLKQITVDAGTCTIGGTATASDLLHSPQMREVFPRLEKHLLLVSSTPIRNMGTVAGNFVNASPIGDLTAFFIALNSTITIQRADGSSKETLLRKLYKDYKVIDLQPGEIISAVSFPVPTANTHFNFEKVSKRTMLDIASVNSAMRLELNGTTIADVHLSAGGVAPIPKYLANTCDHLRGKELAPHTILEALQLMQDEVAPISDARGTAEYKRLLLRQLVYAHFAELWPELFPIEELASA
jgi:xanthine dehydrogenase small subunit